MAKVYFSMAGSGSWRRWFPDDAAHTLYERVYPQGVRLDQLPDDERDRVRAWEAPGFVEIDGGMAAPLVPVFTDEDCSELAGWFSEMTEQAVAVVGERIGDYRELAAALSHEGPVPPDHLLTILLCAHTLDMGTLEQLQSGILGVPPPRAGTGDYFFWGRTAHDDQARGFGVDTHPVSRGFAISILHSDRVERAEPATRAVAVPVFDAAAMRDICDLCVPVSQRLAVVFSQGAASLQHRLSRCSFGACSRPDVLCMLFHIGYGHVASALMKAGLLPEFPRRVDDAWGIWIRAP